MSEGRSSASDSHFSVTVRVINFHHNHNSICGRRAADHRCGDDLVRFNVQQLEPMKGIDTIPITANTVVRWEGQLIAQLCQTVVKCIAKNSYFIAPVLSGVSLLKSSLERFVSSDDLVPSVLYRSTRGNQEFSMVRSVQV